MDLRSNTSPTKKKLDDFDVLAEAIERNLRSDQHRMDEQKSESKKMNSTKSPRSKVNTVTTTSTVSKTINNSGSCSSSSLPVEVNNGKTKMTSLTNNVDQMMSPPVTIDVNSRQANRLRAFPQAVPSAELMMTSQGISSFESGIEIDCRNSLESASSMDLSQKSVSPLSKLFTSRLPRFASYSNNTNRGNTTNNNHHHQSLMDTSNTFDVNSHDTTNVSALYSFTDEDKFVSRNKTNPIRDPRTVARRPPIVQQHQQTYARKETILSPMPSAQQTPSALSSSPLPPPPPSLPSPSSIYSAQDLIRLLQNQPSLAMAMQRQMNSNSAWQQLAASGIAQQPNLADQQQMLRSGPHLDRLDRLTMAQRTKTQSGAYSSNGLTIDRRPQQHQQQQIAAAHYSSPDSDDSTGAGGHHQWSSTQFGRQLMKNCNDGGSPTSVANSIAHQQQQPQGLSPSSLNDYNNILQERQLRLSKFRRRFPSCTECVFCKNNGTEPEFFKGHILKDPEGIIQCPVLRRYNCPICQNGGGNFAHTIRYCPLNRPQQWRKARMLSMMCAQTGSSNSINTAVGSGGQSLMEQSAQDNRMMMGMNDFMGH